MKGRALELLTVLGKAVGPERFSKDAQAAMSGILSLVAYFAGVKAASASSEADRQGTSMPTGAGTDDPLEQYVWEAVSRVAKTLGPAFQPYLPAVMPPALASATAPLTVVEMERQKRDDDADPSSADAAPVDDDDDSSDDEDGDGVKQDFYDVPQGNKVLRVRTPALEDKLQAFGILGSMLHALRGPAMQTYAASILETSLKCLADRVTVAFEDLRGAAAMMLTDCMVSLASATTVADVLVARDNTSAATPAAATFILALNGSLQGLLGALEAAETVELQKTLMSEVGQLLNEVCTQEHFAGVAEADFDTPLPLLLPSAQHALVVRLLAVRQAAVQRRAVRAAEMKVNADDLDEEALEDMKDQEAADANVRYMQILHCITLRLLVVAGWPYGNRGHFRADKNASARLLVYVRGRFG
jgi:hypothetical protein